MYYNIDSHPLQIMSSVHVKVEFSNKNDEKATIAINPQGTLDVENCNEEIPLTGVPDSPSKVWTITKSKLSLTIECNDFVVGRLYFHGARRNKCLLYWRSYTFDHVRVSAFEGLDYFIRTKPGNSFIVIVAASYI